MLKQMRWSGRCCGVSNRETVYFNDKEEQKIYDHAMKQGKKFSTYVKELILQDMNKESLDEKIEKKIEAYFNKYLKTHEITTTQVEFTNEDVADLKEFMR